MRSSSAWKFSIKIALPTMPHLMVRSAYRFRGNLKALLLIYAHTFFQFRKQSETATHDSSRGNKNPFSIFSCWLFEKKTATHNNEREIHVWLWCESVCVGTRSAERKCFSPTFFLRWKCKLENVHRPQIVASWRLRVCLFDVILMRGIFFYFRGEIKV